MKKIINGLTYNTETANKLVSYVILDPHGSGKYLQRQLYITKKGKFFIFGSGNGQSTTWAGTGTLVSEDFIDAIDSDRARLILEEHANELVSEYFNCEDA